MAKLDNNPRLAQYLDENKPFTYAHLIKFERPARLGGTFLDNGNILLSNKYTRYAYITDASFDIEFDDNSTYWNGSSFVTNPAQVYRANKVLKVGSVGESADTKIANISISLDASSIDAYLPIQALTFASSSLITATDSFSLAGFREGDVVKFSSTSGANNGKSFRILSFRSEGKTILVEAIDDTFTNETGFNYTTSIASTEITSLIDLDQSTNFVNRQVYIYKVFFNPLNPTLSPTSSYYAGAPVLLFNGIITNADYKEDINSTPEITWTIRNHWADFQQIRGRLTADEFHRALDVKGNPSHRGVIRPEYVYDKGFQHANKAIDVLATYTTTETRYKKQTKSGVAGTNKKVSFKPYEATVTREVDLRFNLQAKYLPVIYGVRRVDAIPVFVDTAATDPSTVYIVDAICEGPVQSLVNLYIDDNPLICTDEQDSLVRDVTNGSADADVVCYGRADRGDVLGGASSQLLTKQTVSTANYAGGVAQNFPGAVGLSPDDLAQIQFLIELNTQNAAAEVYNPNTSTSSNIAGSGLAHESKFNVTLPLPMEIEFKTGQEDQLASAILVSQANQNSGQGFKLQDDANIAVNNYWGPDHRLLDTAYAVQKSSLTSEQTTIPSLEYVVKGRLLPCYNYDYSFVKHPKQTSAAHTIFGLGDSVSLYTVGTNNLLASNVQIIDKWFFYGANGIQDYRFRFNLTGQQQSDLLAAKQFYMQKGTDRWYMITHDYTLGTFTPGENLTKKISSYTVTNNQIVATFAAGTIPSYLVGTTNSEGSLSLDLPSVLNSLSQGRNINYSISSNYKLTVTSATSVTLQNSGSTNIDVTNLYLNISNKVKLPVTASSEANYYVGYIAKITNYLPDGTTAVIYRKITGYDNTNKVLTLYYPLAAEEVPTTTSRVEIILPLEYGDYRPTTNFSMMLLDYMTNRKYGAGLIDSQINKQSFLEAARTCDTKSDITVSVPSTTTILAGDVYKYESNSLFKWQGTVKSVGQTVGSVKSVVFTSCIGKLTHKFNSWASRQLGDVIHDSDVTNLIYRITTAGVQSTITSNAAQLSAGQFTLTRVTGSGDASVSLGVSAGNPVTDYSLYDSDFIKYWKYLGWDSHDQRWVTRHQGNIIINTAESVLNNISSLLNHFNGVITFENGKYSVYVETKRDPDQDLWWNFLNSVEGWTSTNIATTSTESHINLNTSAAGGYFEKTGLEFLGVDNSLVRMKVRRVSGTGLVGRLWYTSLVNPTYNQTYSKVISPTLPIGEWTIISWDMSNIGGLDPVNWTSNYITGLRFELGATAADDFDIEWIAIGTNIRVIEQEDIIGSITVKDEGLDKSYNSLSASIPDPQNNFNTRAVSFFNSDYLAEDRGVVKSTNFDLDGVTNYYNARMGVEQVLRRSRYARTISFTMRPVGLALTPSDLIRIVYPRFGWNQGKYFRVSTISHREDCLVTITADEHSDSIYNIEASKKLKSLSENSGSRVFYPPAAPTNIAATSAANGNEQLGIITLSWTAPSINSALIPYMEVWRSTSSDINTATLVANFSMGISPPFVTTYSDTGLDPAISTTYYYWLRTTGTRIQNLNGRIVVVDTASAYSSPVAGSTRTSAAQYVVVNGAQTFKFLSGQTVPTENSIVLTASLFGGLTTYDWEYWTGSAWQNLSGTQNSATYTLTYNNAAWGTSNSLRIRCLSGTQFDEISVVKLFDGTSNINILYTNSSHSVPVSVSGVETWTGSGGLLYVYEGTTPLLLDSNTQSSQFPAGNGAFRVDITYVSGSTLSNEPTITGVGTTSAIFSNWGGDLTTVTVYRVTAYIRTSTGATLTRETDLTLAPTQQGSVGADSVVHFISTTSPVITKDAPDVGTSGAHSSVTIQGKRSTGATTVNFGFITVTANGATEATTATDTSTNPIVLTPGNGDGKTNYTVKLYNQASVSGATLLDTEVIPVIFKGASGANAIVAAYTNDSHSVPVTSAGIETWTGSGGLFYVYEGTTALTLNSNTQGTAYPAAGFYNLNIQIVSGANLTEPTITGQNTTTATFGNWAGDLTVVTVYRVTAYITTSTGVQTTREVDLTLSPSFQGATGSDSSIFWLSSSSGALAKDATNTFTPSTVTFNAFSRVGSNAVAAYAGRFKIYENGSATAVYTSSANESVYAYTPTSSCTSIKVELYQAGGTTTELDELGVAILNSASDAITVVLSNESHVLPAGSNGAVTSYSGSGTIVRVYQGATELDYDGVGTANGKWNVTASASGITAGTKSESGLTAVFADHSAMDAGTEVATITYTITGKTSIGAGISLTKTQTFSKSKAGENVTVIYIRSSAPPATPSASSGTPAGWYATTTALPAGSDPIWSSTGTRTSSTVNWTWQTPIKVTSTTSGRANPFTHNWVAQDPFTDYNGSLRHYYGGFGNMPIVSDTGPYSAPLNILRVRGTTTASAPGWFGAYRFDYGDVDPSSGYLIYFWVKRRSSATINGFYAGPADANPGHVEDLAGTIVNNAYFSSNIGSVLPVGQWTLFVGIIHPQGTTVDSGIGGIYDIAGTKITETTEFRHKTSTPTLRQRIRIGFNSTTTTYGLADGYDFYPVGIFKRDGAHPTIDEVLKGIPYYNGPQVTGLLSNPNVTVTTLSDGTGASFATAGGTFRVFERDVEYTNTTDGPVYSVVGSATSNGLTFSINASTGVYSLAGTWTSDSTSFTARAWFRGQVVDQVYRISKARQGASAYNGLLTNENATAIRVNINIFSSVTYSFIYEGTEGAFKVYEGTTERTSGVVYGISGGTVGATTTTKTQNGLTMTINNSTGAYSLSGVAWTTAAEQFTLTATVGGITIQKLYSIIRSDSYSVVSLTSPAQTFKYDASNANPSPATIVLTANIPGNPYYGSYQFRFSISTDGGQNWTTVQDYAAGNTYTVSAGAFSLGTEQYRVEVRSTIGGTPTIVSSDVTTILRIKDGLVGSDGSNVANVVLYRRTSSTTAPAVINDTSTYTFSTGILSNPNGLDSWTQSVPSGTGQYLWVTNANAIGVSGAATASILTSAWSTPVIQSEAQQLRSATKLIYNAATGTTGVNPPTSTTTGTPYNFTTGVLTIGSGGTAGWTNNQLVTPPYWVSSVSIAETVYDTTQTVTYGTPYRVGNTANRDESGLNLANLGGSVGAGQVNITTGGDNLLMNSEFETRSGNAPSGFEIYNNGGVGSSFIDAAGYISGKAAAVKAGSTPGTSLGILSQSTATGLGVTGGVEGGWKAGVTYIISYYAKKVAGAGFSTMFIGWNRPPNSINVGVVNPTLSTSWQRYVFRIAWAANATVDQIEINGRVYISAGGTIATNDEIHIDRLQVEIADLASEWRSSRRDSVFVNASNAPDSIRNNAVTFSVNPATGQVSLANAGVGSINLGSFNYTGELDATRGAVAGTNLRDSGNTVLSDAAVKNAAITLSAAGVLSGAGGGSVTIGGLGYTGELDATRGAVAGTNLRDSANTVLSDAAVKNAAITLSAAGVLSGAGGGSVTIGGLGYTGELNATRGAIAGTNLRDSLGGTLGDAEVDNRFNTYGQNLFPNSDIVTSTWQLVYNPNGATFRDGASAYLAKTSSTGPNYVLLGSTNNIEIRQVGVAAGTNDGSGNDAVGGDFYPYTDQGQLVTMAVTPGQTIIASVYINAHRSSGHVYIGFFNSANTIIQYAAGNRVTGPQGFSNTLAGYDRSSVKTTVPANTAFVVLFVRKYNTLAGNSDSYMWWAAPQLEVVNSKATGPSPYQPGPMTSTRQLGYTGELNATYGAVAGATLRNSAGTVLQNADILNSVISLSAAGVLSGAGGGTVTIGGLGYAGDLDAQRNSRITVDADGILQGTGTANIAVNNSFLETQSFVSDGVKILGNTIVKTRQGAAWDAQAYSKDGYTNGAFASFSPTGINQYVMVGLNSDPATNSSYTSIDYAFYIEAGTNLLIYENGSLIADVSPFAIGDILTVSYDGSTIRYVKNGTIVRSVQVTITSPLHFDSSFYLTGSSISKIKFGPLSSNNWNQITNQPAGIYNSNISITGGTLNGIGTGNGTAVANSSITIAGGQITGIGSGAGTYVVRNLEDASVWKPGVAPPWGVNQSQTGENSIIWGIGPKGGIVPLWKAESIDDNFNDSPISGADGGWHNVNTFRIDTTKTYRFMVPFIQNTITANTGSFYWGVQGSTVCNLNTTTVNTNPYFHAIGRGVFSLNKWYLAVGFVYPAGSTGVTNTGAHIYDMSTGQIITNGANYCWNSASTSSGSRAYLYYAGAGNIQYFAGPTVELVDGKESSINELLQGTAIFNQNITVTGGALNGIGTGNGTAVANSSISISAAGALSGAGGGTVTIGGLGYSGDLDAQRNSRINITSGALNGIGTGDGTAVANTLINIASGALNGIGTGNGTAVANSSISLSAAGALSGAGGGTISLGSVSGTLNVTNQMSADAITSRELAVSNNSSGGDGIFIDNVNKRIDIYDGGVLRLRIGAL